jgi:hypothetical protein
MVEGGECMWIDRQTSGCSGNCTGRRGTCVTSQRYRSGQLQITGKKELSCINVALQEKPLCTLLTACLLGPARRLDEHLKDQTSWHTAEQTPLPGTTHIAALPAQSWAQSLQTLASKDLNNSSLPTPTAHIAQKPPLCRHHHCWTRLQQLQP